MRAVLASDDIANSVQPSRRGDARWVHGDLEYWVWVDRTPGGEIRCEMNVADATFAERMAEYGRLSVMIRSADTPPPWPDRQKALASVLPQLVAEFQAELGFVSDRADLCWLLSQEGDVHRGRTYAWLPRASYPGRLVQALIVARDAALTELEKEIRARLASPSIQLPDGSKLEITRSARQWADRFSKALRLEIEV